jgi:putative redox protein
LPVEDVQVQVERDGSQEQQGVYKLKATVTLVGPLTPEDRERLLQVAAKCPIHKLMTQVTTEIETVLAD